MDVSPLDFVKKSDEKTPKKSWGDFFHPLLRKVIGGLLRLGDFGSDVFQRPPLLVTPVGVPPVGG